MDVRTLCLAVLTKGDATGYEIKKAFEEGPFSHFQRAGFGSIYPALSRLLSEGMVRARAQEQDGRPDKKVYSITAAGTAAFHRELEIEPEPDTFRSDFLFLMFFASQIPERRIRLLVDRRIAMYRERQETIDRQRAERLASGHPPDPGREFVAGFGEALYRTAAEYLEANRDALINGFRHRREPSVDAAE